jgi:MFS transporter, DHA2 family, multidrug resistance protein
MVAGVLSFMTGAVFVRRTLRSSWPLVDLRTFRDRNFTVGCVLSFVLGIGLFGSVYLMPVFLVYVRGHSAFEVGMIIGHRRRAVRHRADRGRARSAL